MTHELEINNAGYIDFVCPAGAPCAAHFTGWTRAKMRVVLYGREMPFAESDLTPVPGRRAANGGKLYQITAEQAEALRAALAAKVESLEAWSADYRGPINS